MREKKYYLIYQIKNLIDGRIYVGAHCTNKVNDSYMGSSKHLKKDIKNLGKQNFEKTILYIFDNKEEMMSKEAEIVNREFVYDPDTYNLIMGGLDSFSTEGMTCVQNPEGGFMMVYRDDPRFLSGELVGVTKGLFNVKDKDGNVFKITKDDDRWINGEVEALTKGKVPVKDKNGVFFQVDINDSRRTSGEVVGHMKGLPQHLNSSQLGKKQSEESKRKTGIANSLIQKGKGNSQYGTCWITKESENKKIRREERDVYLHQGWIKGRKI